MRAGFHLLSRCVQSEAEELRQVMWLSVLLYQSPQAELPCCLLLSTDAIYFLLAESAGPPDRCSGTVFCELRVL